MSVLDNLALAHRADGRLGPAIQPTEESLPLCAAVGDRHREAALHNNLVDLWHSSGRPENAMTHLKRAVEMFADVGVDTQPQPEIWKLVRW